MHVNVKRRKKNCILKKVRKSERQSNHYGHMKDFKKLRKIE